MFFLVHLVELVNCVCCNKLGRLYQPDVAPHSNIHTWEHIDALYLWNMFDQCVSILLYWQGDQKDETHFHIALSIISQSLKTQIINRSYDEVAICFFNTVRYGSLQEKICLLRLYQILKFSTFDYSNFYILVVLTFLLSQFFHFAI